MLSATHSAFSVKKSALQGVVKVPPSKSQTLRAILFASLAKGVSTIRAYLDSPDTLAMIQACRLLGAEIDQSTTSLRIRGIDGVIGTTDDVINAGNSGLVLRLIAAVGSLGTFPIVITGDQSIRHQRPMTALLQALHQANVHAISTKNDGFAPVIIQGPFQGGVINVDGSDSQPISALLIAASLSAYGTTLHVHQPGEKPWVALTLKWLDRFNITYRNDDFRKFEIMGGQKFSSFDYTVPGDFSSAAFPIGAAVITNSEVTVSNLDFEDPQGDKKVIEILQKMGANIAYSDQGVKVQKNSNLEGIEVDINDCIDALPILAVIGCFAKGKTIIKNAQIARHKECDRIANIAKELRKLGAHIIEHEDGLTIYHSRLRGERVDSHYDHRLGMALTVAGLGSEGVTTISSVASIAKTFPHFFEAFRHIEANISLI
ncbi:MAG: 3-phosphoshikimate 1-carboxyvinyltransferase [Parachlamydiaceae bacterium]